MTCPSCACPATGTSRGQRGRHPAPRRPRLPAHTRQTGHVQGAQRPTARRFRRRGRPAPRGAQRGGPATATFRRTRGVGAAGPTCAPADARLQHHRPAAWRRDAATVQLPDAGQPATPISRLASGTRPPMPGILRSATRAFSGQTRGWILGQPNSPTAGPQGSPRRYHRTRHPFRCRPAFAICPRARGPGRRSRCPEPQPPGVKPSMWSRPRAHSSRRRRP